MNPILIPDDIREKMGDITTQVIMPTDEALFKGECNPVEVIVDHSELGPRYHVLFELNEVDLENLDKSPRIWLTVYGDHVHPFALTLDEEAFE